MNRLNEKKQNIFVITRFVIIILLIVMFLVMSTTHAYWASGVEGRNSASTSTFIVGFPSFDIHEFILDNEVNSHNYLVPINELLSDPQNNYDDVVFGIIWNDPLLLLLEDSDQDISAYITVSYDLLITFNGKEVNRNTYNRYAPLINLEIDPDNPVVINYNDLPETFEFSVSLNEETNNNGYSSLSKYDVYIVVTYSVVLVPIINPLLP